MNFRHFLDASYTLLVEEYQTIPGSHLSLAIESAGTYQQGGAKGQPVAERTVVQQNQASLQQLDSLMAGVKRR